MLSSRRAQLGVWSGQLVGSSGEDQVSGRAVTPGEGAVVKGGFAGPGEVPGGSACGMGFVAGGAAAEVGVGGGEDGDGRL